MPSLGVSHIKEMKTLMAYLSLQAAASPCDGDFGVFLLSNLQIIENRVVSY